MSTTTNISAFCSRIPVGTHVSFLPRALKAQDAAKIGTTKSTKERVYGFVQSYSNEGNVVMASIRVANPDRTICKLKAGNLKKEREVEENTGPSVPEGVENTSNTLVNLGIDYDSDTDGSDGQDAEEELEDQEDNAWISKRVTIDVRYTNPSYKDEHPSTIAAVVTPDPLVPIRAFVDKYNANLLEAMVPGRVLTIDETMNQWVGKVSRMPNVKKIISKPHPVGQEFKTIADASTNIIIRLDISEKNFQLKKFGNQGAVISTVLRLSEPWFAIGRTILADSWFGSPTCAAVLYQHGLYSIMAMEKRSHWPKLTPRDLHLRLEGKEVGFSDSLVGSVDEVPMSICILRDRKMQCVVSTCSKTTLGSEVTHVIKEGNRSRFATFRRPTVFDGYGAGKGAVDINNNNRDNMASYHDVMRTHSWEIRAFSFFLALAEANAYLAWRSFGLIDQRNITHFSFREQLCTDMINEYMTAVDIAEENEEVSAESFRNNIHHDLEPIGKSFLKNGSPYSRQWRCQICKKKTTLKCSCTPTVGLCKSNCYRLHLIRKQQQ